MLLVLRAQRAFQRAVLNRKQWLFAVTSAWGGALVAIVLTASATRGEPPSPSEMPVNAGHGASREPHATEAGAAAAATTLRQVPFADVGSAVALLDLPRVLETESTAHPDVVPSSDRVAWIGATSAGAAGAFGGAPGPYGIASSSSSAGGPPGGSGPFGTGTGAGAAALPGAVASRATSSAGASTSIQGVDVRSGNGREIASVPGQATVPDGFVVHDDGDVPDVPIPFDSPAAASPDELIALGAPSADIVSSGPGPSVESALGGPAGVPASRPAPATTADVALAATVPEPTMPALLGIAVMAALVGRRGAAKGRSREPG
jgi:hypothetical protein